MQINSTVHFVLVQLHDVSTPVLGALYFLHVSLVYCKVLPKIFHFLLHSESLPGVVSPLLAQKDALYFIKTIIIFFQVDL